MFRKVLPLSFRAREQNDRSMSNFRITKSKQGLLHLRGGGNSEEVILVIIIAAATEAAFGGKDDWIAAMETLRTCFKKKKFAELQANESLWGKFVKGFKEVVEQAKSLREASENAAEARKLISKKDKKIEDYLARDKPEKAEEAHKKKKAALKKLDEAHKDKKLFARELEVAARRFRNSLTRTTAYTPYISQL